MEKLFNLQINVVLSFILIILLVHAFYNMNKTMNTSRLFMSIMILTCISLLLEIADVLLNTPRLKQFYVIHFLVNLVGFILAPCVPYLGCSFIRGWINRFQKRQAKENIIVKVPLFINMFFALSSWTGYGAFGITDESLYYRGEVFWILPLVSYFYFGYSLYNIFKYRKRITFSEQLLFSSFYLSVGFFTAIQLINSSFFTIWNSSAVICIVIYILILDDQAYRDALTGLHNRLYYERYIQNFNYKKQHNLVAVYIDLDKFKIINDQYGHNEGDDAIRIFSNLLKESFIAKNKKIMRVGGDEFIVLVKGQPIEVVNEYVLKLQKAMIEVNETRSKTYELSFSYGIASYDSSYETISQFFEHTDHLMYGNKREGMKEINNFG